MLALYNYVNCLTGESVILLQKLSSPKKPKTKAPPVKTKKKGLSYNSHLGSRIKRSKSGYFIQFQHLYQTNHRIPANYRKTQGKIDMKKPVSWLSCGVEDKESQKAGRESLHSLKRKKPKKHGWTKLTKVLLSYMKENLKTAAPARMKLWLTVLGNL